MSADPPTEGAALNPAFDAVATFFALKGEDDRALRFHQFHFCVTTVVEDIAKP